MYWVSIPYVSGALSNTEKFSATDDEIVVSIPYVSGALSNPERLFNLATHGSLQLFDTIHKTYHPPVRICFFRLRRPQKEFSYNLLISFKIVIFFRKEPS